MKNNTIEKYLPCDKSVEVIHPPLVLSSVKAGFPSPAEDYAEETLDLNKYVIKNNVSTFFVRAKGESMVGAGIKDGDLLVVDRSISATNGQVVIAVINGEFTVKTIEIVKGKALRLLPANDEFKPIHLNSEIDFQIWGVVTAYIHKL